MTMNYLDLAKNFRELSNDIESWMHKHFSALSPESREHVDALITSLRSLAANYFIKASRADVVNPAVAQHVASLQSAIANAQAAVANVKKLKKMLRVLSGLIGLATSLSNPTPAGVVAAVSALQNAVSSPDTN
jgi:hypothetical protein